MKGRVRLRASRLAEKRGSFMAAAETLNSVDQMVPECL